MKGGLVGGLVSTVRRNSVPTRGFCGACSGDLGAFWSTKSATLRVFVEFALET